MRSFRSRWLKATGLLWTRHSMGLVALHQNVGLRTSVMIEVATNHLNKIRRERHAQDPDLFAVSTARWRTGGDLPRRARYGVRRLLPMNGAAARGHEDEHELAPALKVFKGRAGPANPAPLYDDTRPLDRLLLALFRSKLAAEVGRDNFESGYEGLMTMIRCLNGKYSSKRQTQEAARRVLKSLFPSWLPASFAVLFSKPFPAFSSRLNAWVTLIASQWLMGPSEIIDVEVKCFLPDIDGGRIGTGHGLLVERCRFLEAAGCASVCLNTCKVPTEEFFMKDMGLALEMKPNYDDFSCQFSFNKTPQPRSIDEFFRVACFEQCPSRGTLRPYQQANRCHQIEIIEKE